MSADEFDPYVERLFAHTPAMADASLFNATLASRLHSRNRLRGVVLSVAGLMGGVIAVRELMSLNLRLGAIPAQDQVREVSAGVETLSSGVQGLVHSGLSQVGLSDVALGAVGGVQMFWIAAATVIALSAAGAMKLSQDV